jgi:hypothetical protein
MEPGSKEALPPAPLARHGFRDSAMQYRARITTGSWAQRAGGDCQARSWRTREQTSGRAKACMVVVVQRFASGTPAADHCRLSLVIGLRRQRAREYGNSYTIRGRSRHLRSRLVCVSTGTHLPLQLLFQALLNSPPRIVSCVGSPVSIFRPCHAHKGRLSSLFSPLQAAPTNAAPSPSRRGRAGRY